jgi:hypothetical protein
MLAPYVQITIEKYKNYWKRRQRDFSKKINNFRRAGYYNIEVNKILDKQRL